MPDGETASALADAGAGVVGALTSTLAFYPLDVIKTNRQAAAHHGRSRSLAVSGSGALLSSMLDHDDHNDQDKDNDHNDDRPPLYRFRRVVALLFRGVHYKAGHTVVSSFAYFFLYSWISAKHHSLTLQTRLNNNNNDKYAPSTVTRLSLAAVAAMANTCLTLPLDVLSARSQTASTSSSSTTPEKNDSSTTQPARSYRALWRGLGPSLLLCSNPAIHYTVFDVVKARLLLRRRRQRLSWGEAFLVGLVAKFTATVLTYPLIRAKVRLMVVDNDNYDDARTLHGVLADAYRTHGLRGLYVGCDLQLLHTVLKSALSMTIRERITVTTRRLLLGEEEARPAS